MDDFSATLRLIENGVPQIMTEPGLSMAVVRQGETVWAKGYGYADQERQLPAAPNTRYRVASLTKLFTATAIMQLYEQGRLRLDDPVHDYLDWFTLQHPDSPLIALRHLLTHTGGIPRDAAIPMWTEDRFQTWDELVTTTQQRETIYPPGYKWKYSNLGFALLGGVVEAVSGQAHADYVQQHILDPLAMADSTLSPEPDAERLAVGYMRPDTNDRREPARFTHGGGFAPAYSLMTTVEDLGRFAVAHLTADADTPILKASSLREMHRTQWLEPDWQSGWGLGFAQVRLDGQTYSRHGGLVKGYTSDIRLCRDLGFAVITLTNAVEGSPARYGEMAAKVLAPFAKAEARPAQPELEVYTGTYTEDWSDLEIIVREGQLQVVFLQDFTEAPTRLKHVEGHTFFIEEGSTAGERCQFDMNDDGSVARAWMGNEYFLPKAD
jgi:CubicO group peptidase (beta-lactamase class C family)